MSDKWFTMAAGSKIKCANFELLELERSSVPLISFLQAKDIRNVQYVPPSKPFKIDKLLVNL